MLVPVRPEINVHDRLKLTTESWLFFSLLRLKFELLTTGGNITNKTSISPCFQIAVADFTLQIYGVAFFYIISGNKVFRFLTQ